MQIYNETENVDVPWINDDFGWKYFQKCFRLSSYEVGMILFLHTLELKMKRFLNFNLSRTTSSGFCFLFFCFTDDWRAQKNFDDWGQILSSYITNIDREQSENSEMTNLWNFQDVWEKIFFKKLLNRQRTTLKAFVFFKKKKKLNRNLIRLRLMTKLPSRLTFSAFLSDYMKFKVEFEKWTNE